MNRIVKYFEIVKIVKSLTIKWTHWFYLVKLYFHTLLVVCNDSYEGKINKTEKYRHYPFKCLQIFMSRFLGWLCWDPKVLSPMRNWCQNLWQIFCSFFARQISSADYYLFVCVGKFWPLASKWDQDKNIESWNI